MNSAIHKRMRVDDDNQSRKTAGQVPQYIPKVKSCIECRQQKIKCDVIKEPFKACSRCTRLKRDCKIDLDYKRISKRDQVDVLKDQVRDLQEQLARATNSRLSLDDIGAVNGDDSIISREKDTTRGQILEDVALSGDEVKHLYESYLKKYHPHCPLLDPTLGSDHYFNTSPILGWTIIIIAARRYSTDVQLLNKLITPHKKLLWATISEMPQRYYTAKSLALLCTWSIPITTVNSRSSPAGGLGLSEMDPTFMLSGIMIQIAIQCGLHRPLNTDDLNRSSRVVSQAEIEDRKLTWALCNIVAQGVAISNGRPSRCVYDWNLGDRPWNETSVEIHHRLKIEKFCHNVTSSLYSDATDCVGLVSEDQLPPILASLNRELLTLHTLLPLFTPSNHLALHAAKLHFHSFAFFLPSKSLYYLPTLTSVYDASITFIQSILDHDMHTDPILPHLPTYLLRTLISSACVLLKILHSSLASRVNAAHGRTMFNTCVLAIRSASVRSNDFQERVAEASTRMWRAAGAGDHESGLESADGRLGLSDPLDLRIRSRYSFSHVYDCIWSWRRSLKRQEQIENQDSSTAFQDITAPSINIFQEQSDLLSTMQDFDLINSLDWNIDDNLFTWQ